MNKLLSYYQKELFFLKQHGKVFANRFPKIARRLGIVEGESEDPHVSRMIESFALLTSRIHQRLDDDMPEVIEELMSVLAPHFLRPRPSTCIVSIFVDPLHSGITGKNRLPAGTALYTKFDSPVSCQFKTVYPVELLPLSIYDALLDFDSDKLQWKLQICFKVWPRVNMMGEKIRLYLHGPRNSASALYALLCSEVDLLTLHRNDESISLPVTSISPVGFKSEEMLLPQDVSIEPIHAFLIEYFSFPQKYSFVDLHMPADFHIIGGDIVKFCAVFNRNPSVGNLDRIAESVDSGFFRLHCTPAINLFSLRAEPISLSDASAEYQVIPDTHHHSMIDVWAISQVTAQRKIEEHIVQIPVLPLLDNRVCGNTENNSGLSWQSFYREIMGKHDLERKLFIAFCVQKNRLPPVGQDIITLGILCTNHTLPHQMQYGNPDGDFDSEAPLAGLKICALTHPTLPVNPPEKSDIRWRFLSQLSSNYQLFDGENGVHRLKAMLALYNLDEDTEKLRQINMIQSMSYKPVTARLIRHDPHSLARGLNIEVIFTQSALYEPDYYLICSFLDRLLALYAPINSFTRLITCIDQEKQTRREWPIRAGKLSWL